MVWSPDHRLLSVARERARCRRGPGTVHRRRPMARHPQGSVVSSRGRGPAGRRPQADAHPGENGGSVARVPVQADHRELEGIGERLELERRWRVHRQPPGWPTGQRRRWTSDRTSAAARRRYPPARRARRAPSVMRLETDERRWHRRREASPLAHQERDVQHAVGAGADGRGLGDEASRSPPASSLAQPHQARTRGVQRVQPHPAARERVAERSGQRQLVAITMTPEVPIWTARTRSSTASNPRAWAAWSPAPATTGVPREEAELRSPRPRPRRLPSALDGTTSGSHERGTPK